MLVNKQTLGDKRNQDSFWNVEKDGKIISPFHDIPLYADAEKRIVNMVVEIPRWSNAKFEVDIICNIQYV